MKKTIHRITRISIMAGVAVVALSSLQVKAQAEEGVSAGKTSSAHFYFGPIMGIDSPTGIIGLSAEAPVAKKFSIIGGAGVGVWGLKLAGGFNYYFKEAPLGSALGVAFNFSTGDMNQVLQLTTEPFSESETVTVNLLPASSVSLFYSYSLTLGKKGKFSLFTGYAVSLNQRPWEMVSNHTLDNISELTMRWIKPGGIMLGLQFMLGI